MGKLRIESASVVPAHHIEGLHQFAYAIGLGAEHAEFNDLFFSEMFFQLIIDFILVDRVLALFEKIGVQKGMASGLKVFFGELAKLIGNGPG